MYIVDISKWVSTLDLIHTKTEFFLSRDKNFTDIVDNHIETVNINTFTFNVEIPDNETWYVKAVRMFKDSNYKHVSPIEEIKKKSTVVRRQLKKPFVIINDNRAIYEELNGDIMYYHWIEYLDGEIINSSLYSQNNVFILKHNESEILCVTESSNCIQSEVSLTRRNRRLIETKLLSNGKVEYKKNWDGVLYKVVSRHGGVEVELDYDESNIDLRKIDIVDDELFLIFYVNRKGEKQNFSSYIYIHKYNENNYVHHDYKLIFTETDTDINNDILYPIKNKIFKRKVNKFYDGEQNVLYGVTTPNNANNVMLLENKFLFLTSVINNTTNIRYYSNIGGLYNYVLLEDFNIDKTTGKIDYIITLDNENFLFIGGSKLNILSVREKSFNEVIVGRSFNASIYIGYNRLLLIDTINGLTYIFNFISGKIVESDNFSFSDYRRKSLKVVRLLNGDSILYSNEVVNKMLHYNFKIQKITEVATPTDNISGVVLETDLTLKINNFSVI